MAITIGTEKQITWAQKIQADCVSRMLTAQKEADPSERDAIGQALVWVESVESAVFFVEMRTFLTDMQIVLPWIMTKEGQKGLTMRVRGYKLTLPTFPAPVA